MRPPTVLRGRCGVWYPEPGEDPCGRAGDWQAPITAAGTTQDIVIDSATGDFIGERARTVEPMDGLRPGTLLHSTSVSYGISPAPGAPPAR